MAKQTQNPTFSVQQSTLNKALSICSKALSDSKIMPIYESFLFSIEPGKLDISACDGRIIISTSIEIQSRMQMKICIPGRKLQDYIAKSANEILLFEIGTHIVPESTEMVEHPQTKEVYPVVTPERVSYSITVKTASGKCTIPCDLGDDFPHIKNIDPKPFTIPAPDFLELLYKTMFAISDNGLRPAMMGLFIVIGNGKIICTATDSHRLSTFTADIYTQESAELIIPKETLQKIQSLSPTGILDISISKSAIDINWGTVKTTSLLIDERYPDYKSVLPEINHIDFVTSKSELVSALKRIVPFSDNMKLIQLNVRSESLLLVAENIDYEQEASETIAGVISAGEPILIGANGEYLLSVLATLEGDKAWFSFSAPNRAMLITSERREDPASKENLFLIMPAMIGGAKK